MKDIVMNNVMGEIKSLCDRAKLAPLYQALQLQEASSEWIHSSFSERLLGLLEAQVDNETTRKISRLRKSAHLRCPWQISKPMLNYQSHSPNSKILANATGLRNSAIL
jgi:hypothetical protein